MTDIDLKWESLDELPEEAKSIRVGGRQPEHLPFDDNPLLVGKVYKFAVKNSEGEKELVKMVRRWCIRQRPKLGVTIAGRLPRTAVGPQKRDLFITVREVKAREKSAESATE